MDNFAPTSCVEEKFLYLTLIISQLPTITKVAHDCLTISALEKFQSDVCGTSGRVTKY